MPDEPKLQADVTDADASTSLPPSPETTASDHPGHKKASVLTLALGSVGVVYGDIGTSPLYALREALAHTAYDGISRADVEGIVSLLLWSLVAIVTIKYVLFLMRADNKGEGGIFSLLALAQGVMKSRTTFVLVVGILGAALFYGDAIITPAISVLSAIEGLRIITPVFDDFVVPLTMIIIVGLFFVQSRGTGAVAALFGPLTAIWFLALAGAGLMHISDDPAILLALNPLNAAEFLLNNGMGGLAVLGSVFLAVTGAEALYADMGHFGRTPIRLAWLGLVFPALALNYMGQGAFVLAHPEGAENPFFLMLPDVARLPMVIMAAIATIIASQAVITGTFSLTRQAVQLGILPRLEIRHTSETEEGQIYLPRVNWMLCGGVLLLVVLFESSSALASAYGIAVTGTMVLTSLLAFVVVHRVWKWSLALSILVIVPFLFIELIFLSANLLKIAEGGYIPVAIAAYLALCMWTWVRGTKIVYEKAHRESLPLTELITSLGRKPRTRVPGVAIFLTSDPEMVPSALMHNLKHNQVLHETNVILQVVTAPSPRVPADRRIELTTLSDDFKLLKLTYGYMEQPNVPLALADCRRMGLKFDIMKTSFFLGRRSFKAQAKTGMPVWQDKIFIGLARSAANATDFYRIPTGRVLELGQQMTI
ncbi:potassium transport protein Kup [Hartmannibacter diazotrophicus]|uniref:Probable potassium transport system protein Kup n=1 Tax=Hartmannibacter diazotrophicus TaxID=1482074 RepID=A0A2C9D5P4_9HYPH|nr:potassium transporter Kup [Hartmannibacter diazotrophicus]SON55479.1 potassium transport protein Kup [Hartmannibacter diazotrophicus]